MFMLYPQIKSNHTEQEWAFVGTPATSNQQPATSNQQPATTNSAATNKSHNISGNGNYKQGAHECG
jgi:hypothetical protein